MLPIATARNAGMDVAVVGGGQEHNNSGSAPPYKKLAA